MVKLAFQIILGSIFIAAGIGKLLYGSEVLGGLIRSYLLFPESLTYLVRIILPWVVLPWVEISIGCLLFTGLFHKFIAGSAFFLIITFIGYNIYSLLKDRQGDCGCFGEIWLIGHWEALLLNMGMLAMALGLVFLKEKPSGVLSCKGLS